MLGQTLRILDIVQTIGTFAFTTTLAIAARDAVRIHFTLTARDKRRECEDAGHEGGREHEPAEPGPRRLFHVRTNHCAGFDGCGACLGILSHDAA